MWSSMQKVTSKMKKNKMKLVLGTALVIMAAFSFASYGSAMPQGSTLDNEIAISSDSEEESNTPRISSWDLVLSTDDRIEIVYSIVPGLPGETLVSTKSYLIFNGIKTLFTETFILPPSSLLISKRATLVSGQINGIGSAKMFIEATWRFLGIERTSFLPNINGITFTIVDDDNDAPIVETGIYPSDTELLDSDPLPIFWCTAADVSGIFNEVYFVHDEDFIPLEDSDNNPFAGTYFLGDFPLYIGTWQLLIVSSDRDTDRANDWKTTTAGSPVVTITDDDTTVDISDLSATATTTDVMVTFTDIDYSGIGMVEHVIVDGSVVPFMATDYGSWWEVTFMNAWVPVIGTHEVELVIMDADSDREEDFSVATFTTTFDITEPMVIEWTDEKLDDLKAMVEYVTTGWKNKNNHNAMINKIDAVIKMKENGCYVEAIEKMTDDIAPKLTGKWIDGSHWFSPLIDQILDGLNTLAYSEGPVIGP